MKINRQRSNLKHLIYLTRFYKCLGLSPKYDVKNRIYVKSKAQIVYASLYMLITLVAAAVYGKQRFQSYYYLMTSRIMRLFMDSGSSLIIVLVNCSAVFSLNYFNRNEYVDILNSLLQVEKTFKSFGFEQISNRRWFYFEILLTHSLVGFIYTYNIYYWFFAPVRVAQFYIAENIQRYHILATVILMHNIMVTMRNQFETLNLILAEFIAGNKKARADEVNTLQTAYMLLTEQTQNYNDAFGSAIFLLVVHVIMNYMNFFNSAVDMKFVLSLRRSIQFIFLAWILTLLWMITVIGISCGATTKTAEETKLLCYELCAKFKGANNFRLYEEMMVFARLAKSARSNISAAGFFDVDYAMLFNVFQMMMSYVLVILQLYK